MLELCITELSGNPPALVARAQGALTCVLWSNARSRALWMRAGVSVPGAGATSRPWAIGWMEAIRKTADCGAGTDNPSRIIQPRAN